MFGHIFINHLKILLKNKVMIFWTLVFPLVLGTFFNVAFSNLKSTEEFEPVNIAVVNDNNFKSDTTFKSVIEELSKDGEDQVFNTKYVSEAKAKDLLDHQKIDGYIVVDKTIALKVRSNGLSQTIIKSVIDNYYQMISVVTHISEFNPVALKNGILEQLDKNDQYFKDASSKNLDFIVVYFYTLIGMSCIYGGFFGINAVNEAEANLSKKGARINVAPTHKLKVLLASLLGSFIVHYTEVLILLGYLIFGLGISFGNQTVYVLLLAFLGSLAGLTLGTVIGAINHKSENAKVGILISVTMACSFLSGMMIMQMKYIIAKNAPIIGAINPVNMITDGLYSLYYYDTLDRYMYNIISLIVFSVVMILISYYFLRRKTYDSI